MSKKTVPTQERRIKRPHTVSREILGGFAQSSISAKKGKIFLLDRTTRKAAPMAIRNCFTLPGFMPPGVDARKEAEWSVIERWIPPSLNALFEWADGGQPPDDETVSRITDIIALHWARTPAMIIAHDNVSAPRVQAVLNRLDRDDVRNNVFRQLTGLEPVGYQASLIAESHIKESVSEVVMDSWIALVDRSIEYARNKFRRGYLHLGIAQEGDFIIGDAPVITMKKGHAGLGVHQGVALGDATSIIMPFSSRIIVGLKSKEHEVVKLSAQQVSEVNSRQKKSFIRQIGVPPNSVDAMNLAALAGPGGLIPQSDTSSGT